MEVLNNPNVYTSKNSVSVYVKQKPTEIKGEIDKTLIMIRNFVSFSQ